MRLQNLRRAIVSFFWVVVAFAIYGVCVVPWIEPGAIRTEGTAADSSEPVVTRSTDRYLTELRPFFPEGSWELDNPKVLRSQQATVLLQEYKVLKDGSLQLRPCTIVFYDSGREAAEPSSRGPVIMQAPGGAIMAFDEPLDLQRTSIGKPVSGSLVGPIHIVSLGRPGQSEDLVIDTSNVQITDQRIWTPEIVEFRIGDSQGAGRDLMLTRADGPALPGEEEWFHGLGIVELQELHHLSLKMNGDDLFGSLGTPTATQKTTSAPVDQSTVEVRCDGPMRFDLRHLIATLEENVRISRQKVGQPKDQIAADRVSLHLARNSGGLPTAVKEASTSPDTKRNLAVRRVVATGNPLVVNAPSEGAYVESKRLEYNFVTGQLSLKGLNPFATGPADATGQVIFRNQQHAIVARSIDFLGGKDKATWRMTAQGPGTYRGTPTNDPQTVFDAHWARQLALQPEQGQQVLRVEGDAGVRASNFGSVDAGTIEFWFRRETVQTVDVRGVPIEQTRPVPTHLVAEASTTAKARLDSAQVVGSLQKMVVIFTSRPVSKDQQVARPSPQAAPSRSVQVEGPDRGGSRYRIDGSDLTAWVDLARQQLQRVKLVGRSRLVEEGPLAPDKKPLAIVGRDIDFQQDQLGRPLATIVGSPARFQGSGLELTGRSIHVRGNENRVWVPGAGTMRLPIPRELAGADHRKPGSQRQAEQIEVTWAGGLNFDGQTALIQDRVIAAGANISFRTTSLQVNLVRRLDLTKLSARSTRPELANLQADGGAFLTSRSFDERGRIKSTQQINVQDLRLDYRSGETTARGPGWIAITSLGNSLSRLPKAPRPGMALPAADDRLMQISVAFQRELHGNIHRREAHLTDQIESWFGPVSSWEDRVDPRLQDDLGPDDVQLTCRELFVLESPTASMRAERRPLELLARGDTHVKSQAYEATGHQIKYAEEKDMLTLEGDEPQQGVPLRPAELWRRNPTGGPPSYSGRARRIRYWPKSQQLEVDGGLGIDVTQLPNTGARR